MVANRPASIWTSSFVSSTFTVDPSSLCTISENNRAGSTVLPSASPSTATRTRIVSSRSVPTSSSSLPVTVSRRPDSTGIAPVRDATARPAVVTASARVSRSQRNFTRASWSIDRAVFGGSYKEALFFSL